jgi:hypothetical protein
MGTYLFEKPLLSNGCCIFPYLAVVAEQGVYMQHYKSPLLYPSRASWIHSSASLYFSNIHFDIILPYTPASPNLSLLSCHEVVAVKCLCITHFFSVFRVSPTNFYWCSCSNSTAPHVIFLNLFLLHLIECSCHHLVFRYPASVCGAGTAQSV